MSSSAVVAVTAARGFGPAAVTFVEAEPTEHPRFFLAHDDYVWIAAATGQLRDDGQFQAAFPHDPGAIDRAVPADDEAFNRQFPPPERDIRDVAF
ncbi:hypothetical protein C5B95_07490 [Rathayibacter sp. AY1A7]|nr:hypothetical protein C5B95_07490 [Rathayibacter sp. AY1A7]